MDVKNLEDMSFEQAMSELDMIVKKLEGGKISLDEAIESFENGLKLKNFCEQKLNTAKMKVDQISKNSDGSVTLEPFLNDVA